MDNAKNFAKVTVDGVYDDTDTSIDLTAGGGARLPTPPFNAVWWNSTDYPDPADDPLAEIVRVTAKATDTLTVTRAQEGTGAVVHDIEGKVYQMIAGLTALAANQLSPVSYDGTDFDIDTGASGRVRLGDLGSLGNGTIFELDDDANQVNSFAPFIAQSAFGSGQVESASGPVGTVVGKLAIVDATQTLVGYIPIYNSIT